jgi:hypothetical protein
MSLDYWEAKEANKATAFGFIAVELELAITFALASKSAISTATANRNLELVREAYGSAIRFLSTVELDDEMAAYLNKKMTGLEDLLSTLS